MTSKRHVLICGASIAGPCLAYWLNRAGFKTTIIERASQFRDGGQNIDVKGVGQTVLEKMNLLAKVRARTTAEKGLRFVDESGRIIAEFPVTGELSMTQEIEILRGDLARVLYDATRSQTTYRFGLSIKKHTEERELVHVEFSDGSSGTYDLVVSAEGVGSSTRKLIMDDCVKFHYLGIWMAYFRVPRIESDDKWARWYSAVRGRALLMRPSTDKDESVSVNFRSDVSAVDHEPLRIQRSKLREVLRGIGWQGERIASHLDYDDDLYMGPLSQVKASRWSRGRFVLVGDAAHSPSPVTGMGTTLALAGAYVLAGELTKSTNLREALDSYEALFRPFAEKSQRLMPGFPRLAHPRSRVGVGLLNGTARLAASRPVQTLLARLFGGKKNEQKTPEFRLPDYQFD